MYNNYYFIIKLNINNSSANKAKSLMQVYLQG